MVKKSEVLGWLSEVLHPGEGDRSIVALGLVKDIEVADGSIAVTLAFPKRPDPLKQYIIGAARAAIYRNAPGGTEVSVEAVVKEAPSTAPKAPEFNLEGLRNVAHIVGVASGKGGVGKSTVAVNLAVALARLGYKVGLVDADVYGPSVPTMTGTDDAVIQMEGEDEEHSLFVPVEKYGVKWLSIGHLTDDGQALIWRGPMASTALKQLVLQTSWGVLDVLLVDMPPGTGDIQISLIGDIPLSGAVIVTTPQAVALSDVLRGVNMFRNPQVNKTIYGLIENMSWFTPEQHPDEKYYLFGRGGGAAMAQELGVPLLGQIPLVESIMEGSDSGEPAALGTGPEANAYLDLARRLADVV